MLGCSGDLANTWDLRVLVPVLGSVVVISPLSIQVKYFAI